MTEYGLKRAASGTIHRTGFNTREEAQAWIDEFIADGGRPGAFIIISREISSWQ